MASRTVPWSCDEHIFKNTDISRRDRLSRLILGHGIGQCVDKMGATNGAAARCAFGIADGGLDVRWITLEDPIVGKSYRKMLPYGRVRSRPNALAPHSLSLERHRAVWAFMQQRTSFFKAPLRMLHLAPEYCYLKRFKKLPNLGLRHG